jgi:hypothetical protein
MANQMMGDRLWNKLNNLQMEIKKLKSLATFQSAAIFSNDSNEYQEFMKQCPISSEQTLEFCENILKTDERVKDKLVYCNTVVQLYFL